MTWVEKRILKSKRRGEKDLQNDLGPFERQCLGYYIERQLHRNASRPAANQSHVSFCSAWSLDTPKKKAGDVDQAGECLSKGE